MKQKSRKVLLSALAMLAISFLNPGCDHLFDPCSDAGHVLSEQELEMRLKTQTGPFVFEDDQGRAEIKFYEIGTIYFVDRGPVLFSARPAFACSYSLNDAETSFKMTLTWQPRGQSDKVVLLEDHRVYVSLFAFGANQNQNEIASQSWYTDPITTPYFLIRTDGSNKDHQIEFSYQGERLTVRGR